MSVVAAELPDDALLKVYEANPGSYTDCFTSRVRGRVELAGFLDAFYRSWVFRGEAVILSVALRRRIALADAARLARAETDSFAAWRAEARAPGQILLCDMTGRTRSWLAAEPSAAGDTVLWFGSAVVRRGSGWTWSAMAAFHVAYSRALLGAAARRLGRG